MSITIYHNPRCSKSKRALELIEEAGYTPKIVLYLQDAPTPAEISEIATKANVPLRDLVRTGGELYRDLKLKQADGEALLQAMSDNPALIQRPLVVMGDKAVVARPPEAWRDVLIGG